MTRRPILRQVWFPNQASFTKAPHIDSQAAIEDIDNATSTVKGWKSRAVLKSKRGPLKWVSPSIVLNTGIVFYKVSFKHLGIKAKEKKEKKEKGKKEKAAKEKKKDKVKKGKQDECEEPNEEDKEQDPEDGDGLWYNNFGEEGEWEEEDWEEEW